MAAVAVLVLAGPMPGCASEPDDRTPEGALQIFLAAVQYASVDPDGNAEAWKLLDHGTQERLRARARRASDLSGARFAGPDMIAVPFAARVASLPRAQVRRQGDRATAQIAGGEGRPATTLDLVRESGRWRIVLPEPPAAPDPTASPPPAGPTGSNR